MTNPQSTAHIQLVESRLTFPWQTCETALLAERVHDLAREIASTLPRGEHRLKDNLIRASSQLLKQLALAACEPDGTRYTATLRSAVRALTDTSLWIAQCIKLRYGRASTSREAWDLLHRIHAHLAAIELGELRPHRERSAADNPVPSESTDDDPPLDDDPPPATQRSSTPRSRDANTTTRGHTAPSLRLARRRRPPDDS